MKPGFNSREKKKGRWSALKTLAAQDGNWEVTYTGFILILLCLFIMLSSFASMEQAKVFQFVKSFSTAVNIFTGGLKFEAGKEVLNRSPDIVNKKDALAEFIRDLQGTIVGLSMGEGVEVIEKEGKALIRISDNTLFPSGSADITPEGAPLLHRIAQLLKGTDYHLQIEGHTDNVPIHTTRYASNWELSTARAVNVLRYFGEKEGFPANRLSAVGFGEYWPLVPSESEVQRARNRRVELVVTPPAGKRNSERGVSEARSRRATAVQESLERDMKKPCASTTTP